MGLSKQYEKCEVCKYKNDCDNKRMVVCAYIQKTNVLSPLVNDVSQPLMQDLAVKHDYRDICIDVNTTIIIDSNNRLEEMKRNLVKEISKELHCGLDFGT